LAAGLAAGLATGFAAALVSTFGATLAAGLAVLLGIALLLFFEDLAAATFALLRASFADALARPFVAVRPAATAFFEAGFEEVFDGEAFAAFTTLFLRVFCDTACARNLVAPLFDD
jgi:hypothetical protein